MCIRDSQGAYQDGWKRGAECGLHRRLLVMPEAAFLFVPCGHQNSIIYRGAQLDGADADGRDKGQADTGIEGDSQVDEDGKFDHRHQNHRQGG